MWDFGLKTVLWLQECKPNLRLNHYKCHYTIPCYSLHPFFSMCMSVACVWHEKENNHRVIRIIRMCKCISIKYITLLYLNLNLHILLTKMLRTTLWYLKMKYHIIIVHACPSFSLTGHYFEDTNIVSKWQELAQIIYVEHLGISVLCGAILHT